VRHLPGREVRAMSLLVALILLVIVAVVAPFFGHDSRPRS
jgi:hypothetical protein